MTFLRNTWYIAGHAHEIAEKPFARTILNEPVLVYRTESGEAVAMDDRCPHRLAPLHRGKVIGDTIRCLYHGLQFDSQGRCVGMPLGGEAPPRARLRVYPLVERYGLLWIWMGEQDKADADLIPDFSYVESPHCDWFSLVIHADANYQLLVDNLLDLSHAEFLHPALSSDGWAARNVATIRQDGDTITITNVAEHDNIIPIMAAMKPHLNPIGKTVQVERWSAPSMLSLSVDYFTDNGEFLIPSAHFLTPETDRSTHYFVVGGQSVDPAKKEITEQMRIGVHTAFSTEDVPLIEAQQRYIGEVDLMDHEPAILRADTGAIRARRHLAKLIRQEGAAARTMQAAE